MEHGLNLCASPADPPRSEERAQTRAKPPRSDLPVSLRSSTEPHISSPRGGLLLLIGTYVMPLFENQDGPDEPLPQPIPNRRRGSVARHGLDPHQTREK